MCCPCPAPLARGARVANVPHPLQRNYEPGSADRLKLQAEVNAMIAAGPVEIPLVINGKEVKSGKTATQLNPGNTKGAPVAVFQEATPELVQEAITGALAAREAWADMPWNDRAMIFLKAADLISNKYRYKLMAATMLGQGKNVWQAEIDAAAEICDFLRFGVQYVDQIYRTQPPKHSPTSWNRSEYRPLEGFVLAVSPFNFTAIGGNLVAVPAIVGNVTLWKPSPMALYSNYLLYQIFKEAGMPDGVIQFVPGPAEPIVGAAINNKNFAGLHFTGSTHVFRSLWKQIGNNIDIYRGYPRIVGETGGKNFHLVLPDADVDSAVTQAVRGAFEYQGQKCSALSRLYVPKSMWEGSFKAKLAAAVNSITLGPVEEFEHFMGPVIAQHSFDKITSLIEAAVKEGGKVVAGGKADDSKGYYIHPTVIETSEPKSVTMRNEIFGPVITVFPYPDTMPIKEVADLIDTTTEYALTGSIFGTAREGIIEANNYLRNSSGMMYINDKCTGAVVGQQPFGGARASGTNDKAGSPSIFGRFLNARTIKETSVQPSTFIYPSNLP